MSEASQVSEQFDLIVVGAGGIGSAAFYHAVKSGRKVLALDRFEAGHAQGSSHGETRIIRQAYFEHPNYVPLLLEAYRLWDELEKTTGSKLFVQSGLLEVGFPDGPIIQGILASSEQHGVAVERISDAGFARRFPMFNKRIDQVAVFEPQAGYLFVEDCVRTHIEAAILAGGEFRNGHSVEKVVPAKGSVDVVTDQGVYRAAQVIVAAGPWSDDLIAPGVLTNVVRKHLHWFDVAEFEQIVERPLPTYFFETENGYMYGFPILDGRMKVARHSGKEAVDNPSLIDRSVDQDDLTMVKDFLHQYMKIKAPSAIHHSVCMYTMTANEHFLVDYSRESDRVVFAAGLSGHGFKFAPVIGRHLVQLLDGQDDSRFDFLSIAAHLRG